jgi:hypothetical protein
LLLELFQMVLQNYLDLRFQNPQSQLQYYHLIRNRRHHQNLQCLLLLLELVLGIQILRFLHQETL